MKKINLIFILILFAIAGVSQNNSAALLSFDGEGSFTRGKNITQLRFPMLFNSGDKINLNTGNAHLMVSDGSEVHIVPLKEYSVPFLKNDEMIVEFDASVFQDFTVESQSNSSVALRGQIVSLVLYPISSKIIKNDNARIFLSSDSNDLDFSFKLLNANTLDEVYNIEKLSGNVLEVRLLPLIKGEEYIWTLKAKDTKIEQLGIISTLTDNEIAEQPKFVLNNKIDYIKAYQYYEENEFYFDAYNVIEKANIRYKDIDLFKYILKKMTGQK